MSLQLNFGAGPNLLPEPWQNLNGEHDIRKPLRFESESVKWILAEHVVEHVSFLQGVAFFTECLRVLEVGGVLRVCFPDVSRFLGGHPLRFGPEADRYCEHMADRARPPGIAGTVLDPTDMDLTQQRQNVRREMLRMLTGWGHQMAWSEGTATGVLLALGFSFVWRREYREGAVPSVDGHHKDVGNAIAKAETTILEATK